MFSAQAVCAAVRNDAAARASAVETVVRRELTRAGRVRAMLQKRAVAVAAELELARNAQAVLGDVTREMASGVEGGTGREVTGKPFQRPNSAPHGGTVVSPRGVSRFRAAPAEEVPPPAEVVAAIATVEAAAEELRVATKRLAAASARLDSHLALVGGVIAREEQCARMQGAALNGTHQHSASRQGSAARSRSRSPRGTPPHGGAAATARPASSPRFTGALASAQASGTPPWHAAADSIATEAAAAVEAAVAARHDASANAKAATLRAQRARKAQTDASAALVSAKMAEKFRLQGTAARLEKERLDTQAAARGAVADVRAMRAAHAVADARLGERHTPAATPHLIPTAPSSARGGRCVSATSSDSSSSVARAVAADRATFGLTPGRRPASAGGGPADPIANAVAAERERVILGEKQLQKVARTLRRAAVSLAEEAARTRTRIAAVDEAISHEAANLGRGANALNAAFVPAPPPRLCIRTNEAVTSKKQYNPLSWDDDKAAVPLPDREMPPSLWNNTRARHQGLMLAGEQTRNLHKPSNRVTAATARRQAKRGDSAKPDRRPSKAGSAA